MNSIFSFRPRGLFTQIPILVVAELCVETWLTATGGDLTSGAEESKLAESRLATAQLEAVAEYSLGHARPQIGSQAGKKRRSTKTVADAVTTSSIKAKNTDDHNSKKVKRDGGRQSREARYNSSSLSSPASAPSVAQGSIIGNLDEDDGADEREEEQQDEDLDSDQAANAQLESSTVSMAPAPADLIKCQQSHGLGNPLNPSSTYPHNTPTGQRCSRAQTSGSRPTDEALTVLNRI